MAASPSVHFPLKKSDPMSKEVNYPDQPRLFCTHSAWHKKGDLDGNYLLSPPEIMSRTRRSPLCAQVNLHGEKINGGAHAPLKLCSVC